MEENKEVVQEPVPLEVKLPANLTREPPANLSVQAAVGATVVKGPNSANPGEVIEIPPEQPVKMEPWEVTLQAFPQNVKEVIEKHCLNLKMDVGSYLSRQILSMMQVYQMKMCPFCAREKIARVQATQEVTLKQRLEKERFLNREKIRTRRERRQAREARRRNRPQ